MKKSTIWILAVLMGVAFIGLLCMQFFYMHNMLRMRNDQFNQSVKQSLHGVSQRLCQDEARYFLEENVSQISASPLYPQYYGRRLHQGGVKYSITTSSGLEADLSIKGNPAEITRIKTSNGIKTSPYQAATNELRDRFLQQKSVLDEVIVNIISQSSSRPLVERADSAVVAQYLEQELDTMDIHEPFEFAVVNRAGTLLYHTAGYQELNDDPSAHVYVQTLFPQDQRDKQIFLRVYFPTQKDYVYSSLKFMFPSIIFTLVLIIIFVLTIILAFRQKKLSEMKNDFINNMTHEFKTPISSISLASQMLNDTAVRKSPMMLQQIASVINDETKRLRFQVEKVLQMSMFERQKATLKLEDVDANVVIFNVVNTFKLKVEKYGGKITAHLDAMDAIVTVDEMHFTNVIFNLLDNAVKYRREDVPLHLTVTSRDISDEKLELTIGDNGIGIRKDDLKKIFEKFYRVSTGNRHDVKGFGLGLAYVHKMIHDLGGEIHVESELGEGTKFIIILPLSKN